MSINILVLEDTSFRINFFIECFWNHDLKITENAREAIDYLTKFTFNYLFLDNDLGQGNGEGIDVVKFLQYHSDNPNNQAIIVVHSWNNPATEQIKAILPNVIAAPFNTNYFSNLKLDIQVKMFIFMWECARVFRLQ